MKLAELGEKVKAKYPEYKDMDSADVGYLTAKKHPEYREQIDVLATTGYGLNKVSDLFFGRTKDFGKTLLSALEASYANKATGASQQLTNIGTKLGSKRNKKILELSSNLAQLGTKLAENSGKIREQQGTMGSIDQGIKPALKTAGEVMDRSAGAFGELAPWVIPTGQLGNANVAQRVGSAGLQGLESGLLYGATTPDKNVRERAELAGTQGIVSGVLGMGIQGGIEGVRGTINALGNLGKNTKEKLWASTLKNTDKADKILKKHGGVEGFANKAEQYNIPNSKDKVIRELNAMGETWGNNVDDVLNSKKGQIDLDEVMLEVLDDIEDLNNPTQEKKYKSALKWLESKYGKYGSQSLIDAYKTRKLLDSEGARNYLLDSTTKQGEKIAMSKFASRINQKILEQAPEVADTFTRYSLLKDAVSLFYKEPAFGLTNLVGTAVGAPWGLAPAVAGTVTSGIVRSPAIKRGLGNVIGNTIGKIPQIPAIQKNLSPAMLPLMRALENEVNKRQQNKQLPNAQAYP